MFENLKILSVKKLMQLNTYNTIFTQDLHILKDINLIGSGHNIHQTNFYTQYGVNQDNIDQSTINLEIVNQNNLNIYRGILNINKISQVDTVNDIILSNGLLTVDYSQSTHAQLGEQGIYIKLQNNKEQKFIWRNNGVDGPQFYLVDENDYLLPFKFREIQFEYDYISRYGDQMEGTLLLNDLPQNQQHQQTKSYIDNKVSTLQQINTHNHDGKYLKKIGGTFDTGTYLNINYTINIGDQNHSYYQINKSTQDVIQLQHNHDSLYINRNNTTLDNNLTLNTSQYNNFNQLTQDERNRQQKKGDVDNLFPLIEQYSHTNYLNKNIQDGDQEEIEFDGQIFLTKLPKITDNGRNNFVNKKYVDLISGLNISGLIHYGIVDINMGWTHEMYEYDFDFEDWYNQYIQTLPQELQQAYGNKNNFVVIPIVNYKTIRIANKYNSSIGYKQQDGSVGTDEFINFKICNPHYYELNESIRTMYKFKIRLGCFGLNKMVTSELNELQYSGQTGGYVNYRIYLLGGPQPLLWEYWNSDVDENPNNLRYYSVKYNDFNLENTIYYLNEIQTNQNTFDVDFCDYNTPL